MKWICILLLSGCTIVPGSNRIVTGSEVYAPLGYIDLCMREPQALECIRE